MSELLIIGGLFLGWALGSNNLSNLFGPAMATRMVTVKSATYLAIFFVILGALFGSEGTSASMMQMGRLKTMTDAFIVCLSAGLVLWGMTFRGIPVSIAQAMVGSVVAWSLFHHDLGDMAILKKTVSAWIYTPFLGIGVAFLIFKLMRWLLRTYPVSLLYKDIFIRAGLICVGAFSAYALGANNVPTISAPYFLPTGLPEFQMNLVICAAIGVGFLTADKKVIRTMGSGLFPLSPMEALIVVFSGALVLFLFSWGGLKVFLDSCGLPSFPLVPVPITCAVIGAIVGVSLAKGGYGLKYEMLGNIVLSWMVTPIVSGLICWGLLTILFFWERV